MKYMKERKKVIETGIKMDSSALTVATWGNISRRLSDDLFALTPSGMDYNKLSKEDIVIMDFSGNKVEGKRNPSSEQAMHRIVYENRKDVKAIVHSHSMYASALAVARESLPACVEDLVQIVGGNVRVSKYVICGTEELGKKAVEALEGRNGALLANHGVIGVGKDLDEAYTVCQIIEKTARIYNAVRAAGDKAHELEQEDINIMRNYFLNKYGQ